MWKEIYICRGLLRHIKKRWCIEIKLQPVFTTKKSGSEFDKEKERELLVKAKSGDFMARQELHKTFKRMLDKIVYQPKFSNTTQPVSSIRLEAENLLDKYIDTWDPSMKNQPNTYLYGQIDKKLMRYVNDNRNIGYIPENYAWMIGKYKNSRDFLVNKLERHPTDLELHQHMISVSPEDKSKLKLKDINRLRGLVRTTMLSTSALGGSDEGSTFTAGDVAFASQGDLVEDYLLDVKIKELRVKVDNLPEPHRSIIRHTFGLPGYPKMSLRDMALKFGVNKYRIQTYIEEAKDMLNVK